MASLPPTDLFSSHRFSEVFCSWYSVKMPSDLAKKKAAKKKESAKARQRTKKPEDGVNGDAEKPENQQNEAAEVNGKKMVLKPVLTKATNIQCEHLV